MSELVVISTLVPMLRARWHVAAGTTSAARSPRR